MRWGGVGGGRGQIHSGAGGRGISENFWWESSEINTPWRMWGHI